jgi:hypothetical protein
MVVMELGQVGVACACARKISCLGSRESVAAALIATLNAPSYLSALLTPWSEVANLVLAPPVVFLSMIVQTLDFLENCDHFGRYVICWPPSEASAIAPRIGLTNTATPSTNWALAAAPLSASTAEALAPKSISFRLNLSIAA